MGLSGPVFDALGREHAHRPIAGDILFLGRQTTYFTPLDFFERMRDYGHTVDTSVIELDRSTHNRNGIGRYITDRSIFRGLGIAADHIKALDVSDYEGAEVVCDLNRPLPEGLYGTADFIVDGSTLDNVFNPAQALLNCHALLRPGGRLLMINAWNQRDSAYTLCSAAWYFDFFVSNGYTDCRVYLCSFEGASGNVYALNPSFMATSTDSPTAPSFGRRPFLVVFAEKSHADAATVIPTQSHYRSPSEWRVYGENLACMKMSPRPHLLRSIGRLRPRHVYVGYRWIDGKFQEPAARPRIRHVLLAAIRRCLWALTHPTKVIERVLTWQ